MKSQQDKSYRLNLMEGFTWNITYTNGILCLCLSLTILLFIWYYKFYNY